MSALAADGWSAPHEWVTPDGYAPGDPWWISAPAGVPSDPPVVYLRCACGWIERGTDQAAVFAAGNAHVASHRP